MNASTAQASAALVRECFRRIRRGSKSFSLAARLYPKRVRANAFLLYAWCRFCDDAIDDAPDAADRRRRLRSLVERTGWALRPDTDLSTCEAREADRLPFTALGLVVRAVEMPPHYPFELLDGMAMDLRAERYLGLVDLERYCYCVAGVVGLQMTYAMGVSDPRAFTHAIALGNAMQMTNIARDVADDHGQGRVYLPIGWLAREGLREEDLLRPTARPRTAAVVAELLAAAEARYAVGLAGLRYLPWRCGLAVAVAACVYREIGRQVLALGPRAWDRRTVVSGPRKLACVVRGLGLVLARLPARWAYLRDRKRREKAWKRFNSDASGSPEQSVRVGAGKLAMDLS